MIPHVVLFSFAACVLAAHFLRQDSLLLMLLSLAAPLLFLLRRRWSLIVLQCCAYAGAVVWGITAAALVAARMDAGLPWIRTALILGAVVLLTLAAGALLNTRAARSRYPR
jgi:hypothetical protein